MNYSRLNIDEFAALAVVNAIAVAEETTLLSANAVKEAPAAAKDLVKNNFPDSSHAGAALAATDARIAAKAAPTHNGLSPTNQERNPKPELQPPFVENDEEWEGFYDDGKYEEY